jgi:hypothetical protein
MWDERQTLTEYIMIHNVLPVICSNHSLTFVAPFVSEPRT